MAFLYCICQAVMPVSCLCMSSAMRVTYLHPTLSDCMPPTWVDVPCHDTHCRFFLPSQTYMTSRGRAGSDILKC